MTPPPEPDPEPGPWLPGECRLPGCDETARSILDPHCSREHERACLEAAAETLSGDADPSDYEELARRKAEAYGDAPERTPAEMQAAVDRLRERASKREREG